MLRVCLTLSVCVLVVSSAFGAEWQTVTSRAGGFTVDFPAPPMAEKTETKRSRGGSTRFTVISCETDNGEFVAFRIDAPLNLPAGTEDRFLDTMRDFFAEMWNGKVASEKKVGLRGGRDFTIRGRPDEGRDESTIRVRMFLVDRGVFAVAVVSEPNQDLPEETGRFLGSLAIGENRIRTSPIPDPEVPGKPLAGWGMKIDTDNDCKFTPGDRSITIETPPKLHDLGGPKNLFNAPRVMQEANGDFAISVRVDGDFKPGPGSNNPGSVPYVAAGIVLWADSHNFIRFERASLLRGNQYNHHLAFLEVEGGFAGANHSGGLPAGPCYLRLERRGSRIFGGTSNNGRDWNWLKPIDTIWPDKLRVGVLAITTSSSPFVVTFNEYELKSGLPRSNPPPANRSDPPRGSNPPRPSSPPPNRNSGPIDFGPQAGDDLPRSSERPFVTPPDDSSGETQIGSTNVTPIGMIILLIGALVVGVVGLIVVAVLIFMYLGGGSKSKAKPKPKRRPASRRREYDDED